MNTNKYVLIADDNDGITDLLSTYVKKTGYNPIVARDGAEALDKFSEFSPLIVLLDVMMPKIDGFEVCKEIRRTSKTPVIMITAKGEDHDKIMGLEIGADDYVVKPFSPGEIMARLKAVLRRIEVPETDSSHISLGELDIDISEYTVKVSGKEVNLTKKEIDILFLMALNKGKVFSRENLLDSIWGYEYYGDPRTVDTHIKRIRAKLGINDASSFDIKTVWGVGYKLEVKND